MDNFTKLLLFLGQQLFFYKRRLIFVEELKQIYEKDSELLESLEELTKQNLITPIDQHHFEITELAESTILSYWNKNVYITGEIGGGSISGNPKNHIFTVVVEFDTPIKFIEHVQIKYQNQDIYLNCVEGFYYEAKSYSTSENKLEEAEEIIYRYLSHLSYHYKIPVEVRATHSGSIDISSATKRLEPRLGVYYPIPPLLSLEENQSRAVAFYRQFRNFSRITTTESRYYQMMSLLKIIEGVNPSADLTKNKNDFINLIDVYLSKLSDENKNIVRGIESKYASKYEKTTNFSEILWEHYRNGIAHWRARGNFLDPDIPDNTIASSINILEQICLKVLSNEYKILS